MFKKLLERIKISFCCKSKCSLNEEEQEKAVEQVKQYDYYSQKKHYVAELTIS